MSPARRWIWNDVVFTFIALGLVAVTYTHLADRLNDALGLVSYRGAVALLRAGGVFFVADEASRSLSRFPFSVEVDGLCSGLRGLALFAAVVLLLELPRRWKVLHLVTGALFLMLINVVRIAHLFVVGASGSPRYALYHEWLWPSAIVAVVLLYRLVMLILGRRHRPAEAEIVDA